MIKPVYPIYIVFLLLVYVPCLYAQSAVQDTSTTYDESIFIISNYSGVEANVNEVSTLNELLKNNVNGFRFYLLQNVGDQQLLVKNPDNTYTSFLNALNTIRKSLEGDSTRILTLFLDYDFESEILENVMEKSGLLRYVYTNNIENDWPSLHTMIRKDKRLVVFSMQPHFNSALWLHYIWDYATEPLSISSEDLSSTSESFDGNPQKQFLVFNGFNSLSMGQIQSELNNYALQKPYLIELLKNDWIRNGKTPNFIMTDSYNASILNAVGKIRSFHSVKGIVSYNNEILDYINWEGLNSLSNGKFSFVIAPGEELTLIPHSPGYNFSPASITVDETFDKSMVHFKAIPLKISDDLEACYLFENNVKDVSIRRNHGKAKNIGYTNDPDRSWVASLHEKSLVRLTRASGLNIKDHDFTVAVWVKIPEYKPGKPDYCILSSRTASYQSGLHLVIRNWQPYLGFFNDDLAGNSIIEEGKWYHIVWRYNTLSKEQAIFVNGKPDAVTLNMPSYKGSDTIYIGAFYNPEATVEGEIDDLTIWSRALGEKEIISLSSQKYHIESDLGFFRMIPLSVYLLCGVIIALAGYLVFRRKLNLRKKPTINGLTNLYPDPIPEKSYQNYIRLFGEFTVNDNNGNNITAQFSPKLKQLFLLLLVNSHGASHGISTRDLSDILWKGQPLKDTKNLRGVTIRNLRLVLESINTIEIHFQSDIWSMKLSPDVYCDYVECLKLLGNKQLFKSNHFNDLFVIIRSGELFMGESFYWLDDTKGYVGNQIVDVVLNFLEKKPAISNFDYLIGLAEQVLIYDPVNDVALSYKMKGLLKQNNPHLAKFTYERFCALYKELYGEPFNKSFDELTA